MGVAGGEKMKSVSIIIPAYNSQNTISDCIHSIKVQLQHPDFVMAVNDASMDDTEKILNSLNIFTKNNSKRIGKAASINSALQYIQTDYVLILDSDTYLERDFIKKLWKTLESNNYDGGSGSVKYIGKNKYSKKVAKRWHNRDWRYNGCCQFFKTAVIRDLKYDEGIYVEDEEIYQRMKDMKTTIIDAWAYTETASSPSQFFNQKLRWARGDAQLIKKYRNWRSPKWLLTTFIFFLYAMIPIIVTSLIFYMRNQDWYVPVALLCVLFMVGSDEAAPFDLISSFKGAFLYTYVFIEVIMLGSKFNLNYWERG